MRDKIISFIDNIIYGLNEEEKLFYLDICNYFHLFLDICECSYLLLFPIYFDIYFVMFFFFLTLHWLFFKNECIITYIEKKLININYKLGSNISSYSPHDTRFFVNNNLLFLKIILSSLTIFIVFYRSKIITKILLSLIIIIIFYIELCKYIDKKKHEK